MTIAPVWPVGPPPSALTSTSILPPVLVTSRGPKIDLRSRSLVKYSLSERPLISILPVPGATRTRATALLRRPTPQM